MKMGIRWEAARFGEAGSQSSAASLGDVCSVPAQAEAYASYQYVASYMQKLPDSHHTNMTHLPCHKHTPAPAAQGYTTTSPALATAWKPHGELCNKTSSGKIVAWQQAMSACVRPLRMCHNFQSTQQVGCNCMHLPGGSHVVTQPYTLVGSHTVTRSYQHICCSRQSTRLPTHHHL